MTSFNSRFDSASYFSTIIETTPKRILNIFMREIEDSGLLKMEGFINVKEVELSPRIWNFIYEFNGSSLPGGGLSLNIINKAKLMYNTLVEYKQSK